MKVVGQMPGFSRLADSIFYNLTMSIGLTSCHFREPTGYVLPEIRGNLVISTCGELESKEPSSAVNRTRSPR